MSKVDEIKKYLSRFSFEDRIEISNFVSYCSVDYFDFNNEHYNSLNSIIPWYADAINLLCVLTNRDSTIRKNVYSKEFDSYINKIKDILSHIVFPRSREKRIDDLKGHAFFSPLFLQQKRYFEYIYTKIFRYYCIYNYSEKTKNYFKEKTKFADYIEFIYFALIPKYIKLSQKYNNSPHNFNLYQNFLEKIVFSDERLVNLLTIDYKDFLKQSSEKCDLEDINELFYSYKVLSEKPIVEIEGKKYLVASHAFDYALTDGLFVRITFNNRDIKEHIGKFAMEDYLYKIAKESNLYKMVTEDEKRKRFKYNKDYNDPADLILKDDHSIIMVESKEAIHSRKSWINDEKAINSEYEICIKGIKNFLKLYRKFKEGIYNPFKDNNDKNKEVFLVYLTLQYFPYFREKIINEVTEDANEKEFLTTHLFISDYYSFEMYFLYKENIFPVLKKLSQQNKVDSFGAEGYKFDNSCRLKSFQKFIDDLNKIAFEKLDTFVFNRYKVHLRKPNNF